MNEATTTLPTLNIYAFRLLPGQDIKIQIEEFARNNSINAGWICSTVGSLTTCNIRFANQPTASKECGYFEIVGLTGIVSDKGCHLHIIISDEQGAVKGGHLVEGCIIYTTAEIIIASTNKYSFDRMNDGSTRWKELYIAENPTHK